MNPVARAGTLGEIGQHIREILFVLVGGNSSLRRQSVGLHEFAQHRFCERNGVSQVIDCLENATRFSFGIFGFVATEAGFSLPKIEADQLKAAPDVLLLGL